MNILFIEDFHARDVPGGGEKNNQVLRHLLREAGHSVHFRQARYARVGDIVSRDKGVKYIIGNFVTMPAEVKTALVEKDAHYVIYEHDHKYLKTRDPSPWRAEGWRVPKDQIINEEFYNKAAAVLGQSKLHCRLMGMNIPYSKIINLGGNLWSDEEFQTIRKYRKDPRLYDGMLAILDSPNPIKGTKKAIKYCESILGLQYSKIPPCEFYQLMEALSYCSHYIFFSEVVETLNRVAVEARMLGLSVISEQNMAGCFSEDWFKMKGEELVKYCKTTMRNRILESVVLTSGGFE